MRSCKNVPDIWTFAAFVHNLSGAAKGRRWHQWVYSADMRRKHAKHAARAVRRSLVEPRAPVRIERHVALVDAREPVDRRAVEHDLVVVGLLELDEGKLHALRNAQDVDELELDVPNLVGLAFGELDLRVEQRIVTDPLLQ